MTKKKEGAQGNYDQREKEQKKRKRTLGRNKETQKKNKE